LHHDVSISKKVRQFLAADLELSLIQNHPVMPHAYLESY
jgi:hypothetical protein